MLLTTILSSRGGPLEITGGGVTIPKKIPARKTSLKGKSRKRWYRKKMINAEEMTYMALLALQGKVNL